MNLPKQPKEGEPVKHFAREVINWMRANTLNHIKGGRLKRSANGTTVEVIDTRVPTAEDIAAAMTHPWKVTQGVSGSANIAAGHVMGYYMVCSESSLGAAPSADGSYPPDSIVLGQGASYAGGSQAITGTQYIYAEIPKNGATQNYAESLATTVLDTVDVFSTVELSDNIEPTPIDTAVIAVSTSAPNLYVPTSGYAAICIAKAINTDGILAITQYITHNPVVFIPIVNNILTDNGV